MYLSEHGNCNKEIFSRAHLSRLILLERHLADIIQNTRDQKDNSDKELSNIKVSNKFTIINKKIILD